MAYRKPRVTFYSKMSRSQSETIVSEISERYLAEIKDDIVVGTLRLAFRENTLHLFPEWDSRLFERLSHHEFLFYRSFLALRSKSDDLDLGIDRDAVAWESYCKSELQCRETNKRLRSPFWEKLLPNAESILSIAKRKITEILGECPDLSELHCKFGPGANVSCRKKTNARHKLSATLGCSMESLSSVTRLKTLYPALFEGRKISVERAEVTMVPKNAKTSRTIEFQPLLNTFVQLGIGSYMKRKLVRGGINLYDQGKNRSLARQASLPGSNLATVDFSSASDSISTHLVMELLDHDWFELLSSWRCEKVNYPGRSLMFSLEKFSAMGNGYTFELESLIFYSLAYGVLQSGGFSTAGLSIYGDDLIVDARARDSLVKAFSFFGFTINDSKSSWDGPFRESCGVDYVSGVNVRPPYVKGRMTPARVTQLHNFFRRYGADDVALFLESFVPKHLRLYGADGYGDGHLVSSEQPKSRNKSHLARGWAGYTFNSWVKRSRPDDHTVELPNDKLLPSYLCYLREEAAELSDARGTDPYVLRGGELPRKISIYVLN